MSLDPIEGQRAKRRAESEAARDSDEIWTPIAAGATAGSGRGGTATLPGATQILEADNTDIYAGLAVLLTYTAPADGTYAFAGAAQINNGGAGSIGLYLCKNGAQVIGQTDINLVQAISCLAIPLFVMALESGDDVTLEAIASGGSSADGAMANFTWLTNIGPLAMTVS